MGYCTGDIFFTCRISRFLWYSIVVFQFLKVWNVICLILGFLSLLTILLHLLQFFDVGLFLKMRIRLLYFESEFLFHNLIQNPNNVIVFD
jgi:hypothetical protein